MSLQEYRCKDPGCQRLLIRTDAEHGRVEVVCPRCKIRQTVYLGGYQRAPRLTIVGGSA